MVLIRPSAALRHQGMDRFLAVIKEYLDKEVAIHAKRLEIDTSRPGFLKLRCQDIEWVTGAVDLRTRIKNGAKGEPFHTFALGISTIRMVAPFDWLAFLRQWRFDCEKVEEGTSAYFRVTGELMGIFGPKTRRVPP